MHGAMLTLYILVWCLALVAMYVLSAITYSRFAKKAGLANIAWFAWVPVLNMILLLRMIGKSPWWLLILLVPYAGIVFEIIWYIRFFKAFGKSGHWTWLMVFLPVVMYIIMLVWDHDDTIIYRREAFTV